MAAGSVGKLISLNKGICHYCKERTSKSMGPGTARYPTRDHVVPKAFGGINSISNYVLACHRCNQKRGTMLFFCSCRDCKEKILDALYDRDAVGKMFNGIIAHNKPRLYKSRTGDNWIVRVGHNMRQFKGYNDALDFAINNGTCIKDKTYED